MSLDPEDFQRIQANLLELKNQNYALEDQCRKQKNALGEAQAKITVYEKELGSAQKTIGKSKKAQEVQQLYKDNESLQHKLRCTEEEFRMQNQTLLEELSKLVTNNEKLEAKIRLLNEGSTDEVALELREEISALQCSHQKLEEEKKALQKETDALRATSTAASMAQGGLFIDPKLSNDTSTVKVDAQLGVSFKKNDFTSNSDPTPSSPAQPSASDNIDWKSKCVELQEVVAQYQDKLETQQKENETLKSDFRQKFESLRDEKDHEIFNVREQSQKLQVQLNNGFSGFKDFKEKKAKEIQSLQAQIEDLSKSEQNEALETLEKQLQESKSELEEIQTEKSQLTEELQEYVRKLNSELQAKGALKIELDEATKTCESRKKLLDEMAIHIQKKTSETDEAVEKVKKELIMCQSTIQERDIEIQGLKEDIEKCKSKENGLIRKINDFESKEADFEMELNQIQTKSDKEISEAKESAKDELKIIKAENEIALRDLTMQLEIANAQKSEFEETVEQLKQEMKDQVEERKIGDKKGQALIKDLKKQLLAEKTRNEKLSEKLKEAHFEDRGGGAPDHPGAPGANSTFSEVSKSECDADRTSNSSWSIYSGQNDNVRIESISNEHSPSPELPQSLPNASNPISADFGAMVEKLSGIEEEKWSLQQKVEMLEISAAAMADDLVKKSNIIQFYCMEGKQDHVKKESVQSTTPAKDKIKNVKKVMDFLVHPDQLDAQYKEEVQRMQRMLEETLTKNMHLQKDLEHLSQEVVRLSKLVPTH